MSKSLSCVTSFVTRSKAPWLKANGRGRRRRVKESEAATQARLEAARAEWGSATQAAEAQRTAMRKMLDPCTDRVASSESTIAALHADYGESGDRVVGHSEPQSALNAWGNLMGASYAAQMQEAERAQQQYLQLLGAMGLLE